MTSSGSSQLPRPVPTSRSSSFHPDLSSLAGSGSHAKRKHLSLKTDSDAQGKYVAGLREVRCRSRDEAEAVIAAGQINRQVFGTMANSVSSRSHGVFTIKVVRIHDGAPNVRAPSSVFAAHDAADD